MKGEALKETRLRGFALMSKERLLEVSAKGGKRAHKVGGAHEFTKEEARAAGRLGGLASSKKRKH
jgi:uncharacterized protein